MSVFRDEGELNRYLREKIKCIPYWKNVWVNKSFAKQGFYSELRKLVTKDPSDNIFPLAQPEIDLIAKDTHDKLFGIQVKYLKFEGKCVFPVRPGKDKHSHSYYLGIGQTLASLMFGFDSVSLWHCFDFEDGSASPGNIRTYTEAANKLVTVLNLPINYYALWIRTRRGIKESLLITPRTGNDKQWDQLRCQLPPIYGKENPLRSIPEVKEVNEFLRKKLENCY